jgi:hypothetical protein
VRALCGSGVPNPPNRPPSPDAPQKPASEYGETGQSGCTAAVVGRWPTRLPDRRSIRRSATKPAKARKSRDAPRPAPTHETGYRSLSSEPALGRRVRGRHYVRRGEQRRYSAQYSLRLRAPPPPAVLAWRVSSMISWRNYESSAPCVRHVRHSSRARRSARRRPFRLSTPCNRGKSVTI